MRLVAILPSVPLCVLILISACRVTFAADELTKMEAVFKGSYSRYEIKTAMDKAVLLRRLPITEENYRKTGSALVALRKETGVHEMDILKCMGEVTHSGSFSALAALCATLLE